MSTPKSRRLSRGGVLASTEAGPTVDRCHTADLASTTASDHLATRRLQKHSDSTTDTTGTAVDPYPQRPRTHSKSGTVGKVSVNAQDNNRNPNEERFRLNQRQLEGKTRGRPSSLGTALAQRGVLTSTTISNISKAKPRPSATSFSTPSSSKFTPSLPKVRPNSCRDFKATTSLSSSSHRTSKARRNSAASDATVTAEMSGFEPPRTYNRPRRDTHCSVASVYTQNSGDEEGSDELFDRQTSSRTSSLSHDDTTLPTESERSSLSAPPKPNTIEYNANPFGDTPIKVVSDVFGPQGIRKESNFNVISARLGSIGGSPELRSMSARFQEIEDLLTAGRENHTRREGEEERAKIVSPPRPVRNRPPIAPKAAPEAVKVGSVAANPVNVVLNPGRSMGPPPRPPRAKSRNDSKGLPAKSSLGQEPTIPEERPTIAAGVSPRKRSSMMIIPQSQSEDTPSEPARPEASLRPARPVSVDAGKLRLSEAQEASDGTTTVLMTREQWEAEYLPRILELERKKLSEEHSKMDLGGLPLKSPRSTPMLSLKGRDKDLPPVKETEETESDINSNCGDEQEVGSSGAAQGRLAKRRSRSPIKSHRSSPVLRAVALSSPTEERGSGEDKDGGDQPEDAKTKGQQLVSSALHKNAELSSQSPFKAALATARANRSEKTQLGSPEKGTERWVKAVKSAAVEASPEEVSSTPAAANVDGFVTPSPSDSDLGRGSSGGSDGVLGDFGRAESVSSGTTASTPTLDIRLHDSLTNLAISDVSTDLMQDDHSLMALYKHGDTSFDVGGKNLYRLLGGDLLSDLKVLGHGSDKGRPASEIMKKAEKQANSTHTRQFSEHTGDHTPRRNLAQLPVAVDDAQEMGTTRFLSARTLGPPASIGGSPAKARGAVTAAASSSSNPVGLGIEISGPFLPKSQSGSPVKARLDSGANAEQAALPPLISTPKRKRTMESVPESNVGDDSTSSITTLNTRNISGSFLMDERLDDTLLYSSHIGTFSGKALSPVRQAIQRNIGALTSTPVVTERKSSLPRSKSGTRRTMSPPLSPTKGAISQQTPLAIAVEQSKIEVTVEPADETVTAAASSAPRNAMKPPGLPLRRPSSNGTGSAGSGPRPSLGSRIPSLGQGSMGRASGLPRVVSNSNSGSGSGISCPPISGARQSLARSVSGERLPEVAKADNMGFVTPLKIRRLPSGGAIAGTERKQSAGPMPTSGSGSMFGFVTPARSATTPANGMGLLAPTPSLAFRGPRSEAVGNPSGPAPSGPLPATPGASSRARNDAALRGRASMAVLPSSRSQAQSSSQGIPKSNSAGNVNGLALGRPSLSTSSSTTSTNSSKVGGSQLQARPSLSNVNRAALPRPSLPASSSSGGTTATGSRLPMRGGSTRVAGAVPRAPGIPF
ncbi:hypothetical protein CF326_g1441 [Tilletia indica]|nr:hypothetical protein CF326_g1441 [Tilletia indica]